MLQIKYKNRKLERICTDFSKARQEYGDRMAERIHKRINELRSALTVEMLVQYSIGRCHPLKGNRKGEYAMDLVGQYRLIFKKMANERDIEVVKIISIEDYH